MLFRRESKLPRGNLIAWSLFVDNVFDQILWWMLAQRHVIEFKLIPEIDNAHKAEWDLAMLTAANVWHSSGTEVFISCLQDAAVSPQSEKATLRFAILHPSV